MINILIVPTACTLLVFRIKMLSNFRLSMLLKTDFQEGGKKIGNNYKRRKYCLTRSLVLRGKLCIRSCRSVKNNSSNLRCTQTFSSEKRDKSFVLYSKEHGICWDLSHGQFSRNKCKWQKLRENTVTGSTVQLKRDGTRWRTGGEVKGKLANGVGSQYPSHYLGTWCIQHYYRRCAYLGCQ